MGLHLFSCLKLYCEKDCDTVVKQKMIKSVRLILADNDYENNVPLKKKRKKDWLVIELFINMMFSQS